MKELEDMGWFPSVLRNFQTEFIGHAVIALNVYKPFIRYLNSLSLPSQPMIDLCSGSGQPAIAIFENTNSFTQLILTDKYPNPRTTHNSHITYETRMTDVLNMEFQSGITYTMFNAFHHFSDEDKRNILNKIKAAGSMAFFVEILEPHPICLLKVLLSTTLGTLLMTPFIQPFSLLRLGLTYILPVNILTITFDGVVSVFKSRSTRQYIKSLAPVGSDLEVFRLMTGWTPLVVIQFSPSR